MPRRGTAETTAATNAAAMATATRGIGGVRTLTAEGDIECAQPNEVMLDIESVLKEYLRYERSVADEAKNRLESRGLPYAQLGKPYCYAGVGPSCYDCSGLTMMAWAQAGVSMSHGSYDQLASFPRVSMDQLQPGDLVYWDSHVGIYVGNGSVLHAPHTGTVVQITPIWPGVIGANRPG